MAAFSPYAGDYEWAGTRFHWRCYATAPVYGLRLGEHAAPTSAPDGRRWVSLEMRSPRDPRIQILLDETVYNFSQILTQIDANGRAEAVSAAGSLSGAPTLEETRDAGWPDNVRPLPFPRPVARAPDDSDGVTAVA